ncbi:RluA family pseudouridine synthase [Pedobacter sp. SYSU D00535]|uniref:RluA family pseudouridine synthase n=1 Tax=Pedobacter sp. SYSU D00535 TaxID=2810308 RepID=UPI001A9593AB|nr:RluA family pseudouridine synthase [Pedobacter sp. SYSU D00535]
MTTDTTAIHSFKQDISGDSLPERFTYPFCYEAHPVAKLAALEVQEFLSQYYDNEHNFGLDPDHAGIVIGKMFGVLVVKNNENQLGFLAAYSGKLAEGRQHPYFVPPVYDVFQEDGIYLKEMRNLVTLNDQIERLEQDERFLAAKALFSETEQAANLEIDELKKQLRMSKKDRKQRRTAAKDRLPAEEYEELLELLKQESLKQQYDLRVIAQRWQERLDVVDQEIRQQRLLIEALKEERKSRSGKLQQLLFENYRFLNARKEWKSLLSIFTDDLDLMPPAGAGECAAPKLLQYAYSHNLQPLAMAEFWWGASPKSEIRKHGEFYPACRSKCGPILGFMLEGLEVDNNPMEENPALGKELQIVFEDEDIIVVDKPAEFLSVPGRYVKDSVQTRIQNRYPGAILVHRLDQSTSGIILIAKNHNSYVDLQKQFLRRTVLKRYLAILDGVVAVQTGIINLPLRVDLDNRPQQMVCYEYGKPAQTRFEVKKTASGYTYIHFFPITGRTHQLRMHAAHPLGLNRPILGDDLYGKKSDRLFLHAEYLEFDHPKTKERIAFTVPAAFEEDEKFT